MHDILKHRIDAFVYDAPLLRYLAHKTFHGKLEILSSTFVQQHYGIALRAGSPLPPSIEKDQGAGPAGPSPTVFGKIVYPPSSIDDDLELTPAPQLLEYLHRQRSFSCFRGDLITSLAP